MVRILLVTLLMLLSLSMTKQDRQMWDSWINSILKQTANAPGDELLVEVNRHILKLERELQNIKAGKRIAAILKPHGGPR